MKLVEDSMIELNLIVNAADALRAYIVLGRTNGHIPGFNSGLYSALEEAIDFDSSHNKFMIHDIGRKELGVISYNNIQAECEMLFFGDKVKRSKLAEKVSKLKKLQDEVNALKLELGEM